MPHPNQNDKALDAFPGISTLPASDRVWFLKALAHLDHGHANARALNLLIQQACWKGEWDRRIIYEHVRRLVDFFVAIVLLVVLLPILVLISIAVVLSTGGSPFFRQLRVGRLGRPFWIYKFR